jgi:hypothetical protein
MTMNQDTIDQYPTDAPQRLVNQHARISAPADVLP